MTPLQPTPSPSASRTDIIVAWMACAFVVATIFVVRWFGPGDLYEKDQPKTIAYTADVVLHHRLALPRDVIYQPATKPPLYNWIGAAAVWVSGSWSEWTLKFPSVLGTLLTAGCVAIAARRLTRGKGTAIATISAALAVAIFFTFGSDVRHGSVIRLSYLARPDMLQCGLLTAAWLCAWIAIDRATFRASIVPATVFWLCIAAAILTKGPAAVMAIVFAIAYAVFFTPPPPAEAGRGPRMQDADDRQSNSTPLPLPNLPRRERDRMARLARVHWEIGIPLLIVLVGGWLLAAYRQDPDHVRHVMLGAEIGSRITEESPEGLRKPVYTAVMWFVTKALPWGGVALGAVAYFLIAPQRMAKPRAAMVWLAVVLVGLSLPAGKRMDYALPAYPPAAVLVALAAIDLARRLRVPLWVPMLAPVAMAAVLAYAHLTKFHESQNHWTDNAVAFTREVRSLLSARERPLVLVRGKHPLPTLLGVHQGSYLSPKDFLGGNYVIMPEQPDLTPILLSKPLPIGFDNIEKRSLAPLGLYYVEPSAVPLARLIALQRQIATWSQTENPYHAPNTVYRDE